YSSHFAIQEITLKNSGSTALTLQVIPFLRNEYRVFNNVEFADSLNAITFTHEELPDGWVLSHNIPYVNPVRDVFLLSRKPQRQTSYRSYRWGMIPVPQEISIEHQPDYVVWGKLSHEDGERCRHRKTAPELMVTLNRYPGKLLTASAPRWGSADPNITPYGFYGIELGNFGKLQNGDVYTIRYQCGETGEVAMVSDTIRNLQDTTRVRSDLTLQASPLPPAPKNIDRDIWGSGTEMRLFWKTPAEGLRFNVYRRDYRHNGYYERVAENIEHTFFTDKNIQGDQVYGYVVTSVNGEGRESMVSAEINNIAGSDFLTDIRYPDQLKNKIQDMARVVSMPLELTLQPGAAENLRIIRGVSRMEKSPDDLITEAQELLQTDLVPFQKENEKLFSAVPQRNFSTPGQEMLYWSAFSLMRQVMLPPEGRSSYNYYVFSREPTWGWGHGGQVFHESITMLAYAHMDPVSAMNSQRVYSERQYENGYINYRTGSYLDEMIEYRGQLTSSAPWYAWQNWEVFKITGDKEFLQEMYESSKRFYNFYVSNRDSDGDGLCEWGGHAVLESVRDARVAVWDEVGWPSNFEGVDVNSMLVKEARALANMAAGLGLQAEAQQWNRDADNRSKLINQFMWDEQTGFYYNVDKKDNDFTYEKPDDLKRQEIIGFLPLWAGIAGEQQARRLVENLTDSTKFWRRYGVPSLSADDSYYNPTGYWNGPVWVEWDFLIMQGLLNYGYKTEARELVDRVAENMILQLEKDHQLWEFYSPDDQWAGYHRQYIWAGVINRMLMDVNKPDSPAPAPGKDDK
ncbi:MAG: trehalase family glycosidase, partial [Calditrichia bacterium]